MYYKTSLLNGVNLKYHTKFHKNTVCAWINLSNSTSDAISRVSFL